MTQKKALILNEPPLKDLTRLSRAQIVSVGLKVRRKAANGRESIIWAFRRDYPLEHITNGQLEKDLAATGGGGNYIVQMFDNENTTEPLSPRWSVPLEGQSFDPNMHPQSRPAGPTGGLGGFGPPSFTVGAPLNVGGVNIPAAAVSSGFPMPPIDTTGQILGPPPPNLMNSGEMRNYDYRTQWQHVYDTASTPGGALDPAHQVSVDFAHKFDDRREKLIDDNARLQEKLAAEKENHVERMFALQQQNQGGGLAAVMPMMLQMMQQQQQQQQQAADRQMQMTLAMLTRPEPKPVFDPNMLAALAAAIVPVATAFITHTSSKHQTQIQAQMKQQELQQQAFQQMFLQGQQKTDYPALIAAGAPILATLMSARQSREELALQRNDQQTQNSMMQLKMLGDIVAERAEASGNPDLAEMVMRFMADIVPQMPQVIGALRGGKQPQQAVQVQQRPQALPAGPQGPAPQRTPAQQNAWKRAQELPQALDADHNTSVTNWAMLLELDDNAAEATAWVLDEHLSKLGGAFTSIPWREAVFHAHHLSDPQLTADRFRAVIDDAYNNQHFPAMVMSALENDTRTVLESVMSNMPVSKVHPAYMKDVLDAFMDKLNQDQMQSATERAQEVAMVTQPVVEVVKPPPPMAAPTAQQARVGAPTAVQGVTRLEPHPKPQAQAQAVGGQPAPFGPELDDDEDDDDEDDDTGGDADDDWGDEDEALGPEALITPGVRGPQAPPQGLPS